MKQPYAESPEVKQFEKITRRYPIEAFHFVREGLSYTAKAVHGDSDELQDANRHVSGQQLCLGLRDFAVEQYGLMAPVVFDHWQIRDTEDFGHIVFAMIKLGLMSKTDEDTIEDFQSVYKFCRAFGPESLTCRFVAD